MNKLKLLSIILLSAVACKSSEQVEQPYTAFTGATIIDGSGGSPIKNGVLLIKLGRVVAVGTSENVSIPKGAAVNDISGKTIVPGFINAHGHVGDVKGIEAGHYSQGNIIDNLLLYARYGITTVVSLGGDRKDAEPLRYVNDTTNAPRAHLFIAGEVITGKTPEEAMVVIERNHAMGVDWVKIRVDDNLGTASKMTEDVYRAVIARSHALGYKIATHMYYLEDARKLLDAGSDMLAHSVRDLLVDEAFIKLIKEKKVCYCPTLTRELSTFVYGDTADFFSDPFFTYQYDTSIIKPLMDSKRQLQVSSSLHAKTYKKQLPVAMGNLKTLCDHGVPIVFGTDSGIPTRFMGYFEHLEMNMMAEAGLTPMQIIVSATKNAAEYMGLKDLGTLSPNHRADFIILEANPLEDIRHMKKISAVFINGEKVVR
jgi:imidazolonepropionase-like amidohydrolase